MRLTAADQKLLQQITSFPWPGELAPPFVGPMEAASDDELDGVLNGYAPLEDMLLAAMEQFRRASHERAANVAFMHPAMSETQRQNWLADTCLELDGRAGRVGVARRFLADDPEELVRFGVLRTRMDWVICGQGGHACAYMWTAVLHALSTGDGLVLNRLLSTLPATVDGEDAYPFSRHEARIYNAVVHLVRGDIEAARVWVGRLDCKIPQPEGAIARCLRGIVEGSPELVAEGLKSRAASVRRIRTLDPHFKLFDETLHSLYALSRHIDPALIRLWDTRHPLPWDTEYHERLQAGGDPMQRLDLSGLPERQRTLLTALPVPDWWSVLSPPSAGD